MFPLRIFSHTSYRLVSQPLSKHLGYLLLDKLKLCTQRTQSVVITNVNTISTLKQLSSALQLGLHEAVLELGVGFNERLYMDLKTEPCGINLREMTLYRDIEDS